MGLWLRACKAKVPRLRMYVFTGLPFVFRVLALGSGHRLG